jgi:hypothetical protein
LPKQNFILITSDQLNPQHYLGKWVDAEMQLKDNDGKLNQDAIEIKRIPGFSTNKLPQSKIRDLFIKFINTSIYNGSWQVGEKSQRPKSSDYEYKTDRNYYFLKIEDFISYSDAYEHSSKKNYKFEFQLKIVHKPLISNYWHFEFDVQSFHGNITNDNAAWKRIVLSSIRDRIQEKSIFEI